ncbi:S66 peptidase family protein [Brevibacterium litoralis]|uniref:S66 peptidase family protein n=1 Tax=Brevibacterium litoralis TaxID=3138935 RepID=UPI0032EAC953
MSAATSPYAAEAPLTRGDRVALVAASGPTDREGLDHAVHVLESWGLDVQVGAHVEDRHPRAADYLAGTDEGRRSDLVEAWCDPDVAAVVCLRGGYGAMRLLDGIDWDRMRSRAWRADGRPTLLTGSSDVTALHRAIEHHVGVPSLFSPMPGNAVFRESDRIPADVHRWMFEPWGGRTVSGPDALTLLPGSATGRTTGGNLALLAGAVGAPESLRHERGTGEGTSRAVPAGSGDGGAPTGSVLLVEDVGEKTYRLDGFWLHLLRSGQLDRIEALVLGSWDDCPPVAEVEALALEYARAAGLESRGVPVVGELGFGHDPHALSAPLGVEVCLDAPAGGTPTLTVLP